MDRLGHYSGRRLGLALVLTAGTGAAGSAWAEAPKFEIYGFAQADYIQDFKRVAPNWDDTLRVSKIPTIQGQFGEDGQSIISARQSRLGVKASTPVGGEDLQIKFEMDLFGTGADEGKTTIRLRHFYGTWGPILAGQTNSTFMDGDVFPNTIDYWGPTGMVFLRLPQVRYTYKSGPHEFAIAIEKPGNDIDPGNIRIIDPAIGNAIEGSEQIPDFAAHYRYDGGWGHIQIAGILRRVGFDTVGTLDNKPKGSELGWGVNVTSNVKLFRKDTAHLAVVYGHGIASYMNDGGVDLAPGGQPIGPTPVGSVTGTPTAEAAPLLGLMFYYDHAWSDHFTTSLGWSQTHLYNTSLQAHDAFRNGQYASINLLYSPDKRLLFGGEFLWGERQDKDGASGHDTRLQISFKYSFSSNDFFH
jgi:hypothetical protein